jgi:phosphatidylglycerophosphate synthase
MRRPIRGADPLVRFGLWALVGLLCLIVIEVTLFDITDIGPICFAAFVYAGGVAIAALSLRRTFPFASLGLCNAVTLGRFMVVAALTGPLIAQMAAPWTVFGLAAVALALDGLDGWLARREGRVSDFGARFDMEVDTALALVLALHLWLGGSVGAFVLILGLPRYLFVGAAQLLPWLTAPLPQRFGRKAVCVLQVAALIVLQLPFVSGPYGNILTMGVAAALIWSFGRDIVWLWRANR